MGFNSSTEDEIRDYWSSTVHGDISIDTLHLLSVNKCLFSWVRFQKNCNTVASSIHVAEGDTKNSDACGLITDYRHQLQDDTISTYIC